MTYLIVGLGNIGAEYEGTRHNVGFRIASALAEKVNASFETARYGDIARGRIKNAELLILKPSTYMNLSGKAVRYYMEKEHIPIERVLVIVDDLALPFGTLRIKPSGSAAGHNGLKNINELIGSEGYARLRIGLGNNFPKAAQVDFVLGHFTPEENEFLPLIDKEALATISDFCLVGIARTMNWHNKSILPSKNPSSISSGESKA